MFGAPRPCSNGVMPLRRLALVAFALAGLLGCLALLWQSWPFGPVGIAAKSTLPRESQAPSASTTHLTESIGEQSRAPVAPTASGPEAIVPAESSVSAPDSWTVRGVVTNRDGAPLASARVWTWTKSELATCDHQGAFELRLASLRKQNVLFASAAGCAELQQPFSFPSDARELRVDMRLGPAFQVRGRVTDESGVALAGAVVATFDSARNSATCAADGTFLLDHLDPGRDLHQVHASKDGYVRGGARVRTQGLLVEGLELVLARGTSVRGIVLGPDGLPLAGVALFLHPSPASIDYHEATTAQDGKFLISNVGAGHRMLLAQHAGFSAQKVELRVPSQPPELPELVLRLAPAHWIAGVVEDATTRPVPEVSIAAQHEGRYLELGEPRTDAQGRFRVEGLPSEGASLSFYADGFCHLEVPLERVDHGGLRIVLERAALVGGRVIDAATREPIERFSVHFFDPELGPGESPISGYSGKWLREGRMFKNPVGLWTSAGDALQAGTVTGVEVRAEGYAPARNARVVARVGFEPAEVTFELARSGRVRGQVLDASGAPVTGAKIYRGPAGVEQRPRHEDQFRSEFTATDSEGRFLFADVPHGLTQLTIFHDQHPTTTDGPFEVVVGAESVRLIRFAHGSVLEGRSLDAGGAPVGDVPVRLVALDGEGRQFGSIREQRADASGNFRFTGLGAGRYELTRLHGRVDAPWIDLQVWVQVAESTAASVLLQPRGRGVLEGRLTVSTGSLPWLMFVQATLISVGDSTRLRTSHGTIAEDGSFRFESLEPGRWQVRAELYRLDKALEGTSTVELQDGAQATVELELH